MSAQQTDTAGAKPEMTPVVVKKYANRRLYNTESSSYITLDNLATMIRQSRDFVVYDAKTGDDITRGVLTQIIVEEESKGRAMLPTAFLRQIIGFYGDSLQQFVPSYLEQAMSSFALQQEQMRGVMQRTMGNFLPPGMQEVGRQNMAMMERAMTLFAPFLRPPHDDEAAEGQDAGGQDAGGQDAGGHEAGGASHEAATAAAETAPEPAKSNQTGEIDALRHEVDSLRMQLAAARSIALTQPGPQLVKKPKREPAPEQAAPEQPAASPRLADADAEPGQ